MIYVWNCWFHPLILDSCENIILKRNTGITLLLPKNQLQEFNPPWKSFSNDVEFDIREPRNFLFSKSFYHFRVKFCISYWIREQKVFYHSQDKRRHLFQLLRLLWRYWHFLHHYFHFLHHYFHFSRTELTTENRIHYKINISLWRRYKELKPFRQ